MKLFIDGSAWIDLLDVHSPNHAKISAEFERALNSKDKFFTHNIAIGIALNEIRRRRGPALAGKFNEIIEEAYTGAHLSILWIGRRTQKEATRLLRVNPNLKLDLYDFAAYLLMNRRRINTIITTKQAFQELGVKVIPDWESTGR